MLGLVEPLFAINANRLSPIGVKMLFPVRDLPRVDDRREDSDSPRGKVFLPAPLFIMWMRRDGQPACPCVSRDDLHEVQRRIDRRLQIDAKQMPRGLA